MSKNLPKKLKQDSIVEAVFEARFDADPNSVSEILFGRLADTPEWRGFAQRRLPAADIPAALRRADPNLRYQAAIDLVQQPGGKTVIRMGPQVFAYARRAPYPGWETFGADIDRAIDVLFAVVPKIAVTRLGLRYINAFTSTLHGITGADKLNLNIVVDQVALNADLNLNYRSRVSDDSSCTVRIATREFAQGTIPENTTVLADLDVFTNEPYRASGIEAVKAWKDMAHSAEKENFFRLLTHETIERLREN